MPEISKNKEISWIFLLPYFTNFYTQTYIYMFLEYLFRSVIYLENSFVPLLQGHLFHLQETGNRCPITSFLSLYLYIFTYSFTYSFQKNWWKLMIMPSVKFDEPVLYSDSNTSAAESLPSGTLPPSFHTAGQFLYKSVVAPRYRRISKFC